MKIPAQLIEDFAESDLLAPHRQAYRFWLRESEGAAGGIPTRDRFDPIDFSQILPFVLMLDVVRDGSAAPRFVFRLFGTGLVERAGRDLTGLNFEEAFPPDHQDDYFVRGVNHILDLKKPIHFLGHSMIDGREHVRINGLLLPFTQSDGQVDIIMSINLREELAG